MSVRMIRLILGKLGRDRNASISVQVLPFGSPSERSAGGAAEPPTTTTVPLYGEYGRIFAGVEGQDIVIETAAGGMVTINLLEDDEDNDRELLRVDAPLAQSPCLVDSQLP